MGGRKVVITGGLGLLGQRILRRLLLPPTETAVHVLVIDKDPVADILDGVLSAGMVPGCTVSAVQGELGSSNVASAIKDFAARGSLSVLHLASVMSGEGEANFEKAMQVNIQGEAYSSHTVVVVVLVV